MKETIKRAVRTFVQAVVGYLAANLVAYVTGVTEGTAALKGALITLAGAAVACGLSAVMNLPPRDKAVADSVATGDEKSESEAAGAPEKSAHGEEGDGGKGDGGNG